MHILPSRSSGSVNKQTCLIYKLRLPAKWLASAFAAAAASAASSFAPSRDAAWCRAIAASMVSDAM